MSAKFDSLDLKILTMLQKDGGLTQRDLAEAIGLSQNALWRRLQALQASGVVMGSRVTVDLRALGLDLTVFVMIKTRHHSRDWLESFARHVATIPEVVDCFRIGGEWDYLLKVVARGMAGYDAFYQRLITGFDFDTVTGIFAMEALMENRPVDVARLVSGRG